MDIFVNTNSYYRFEIRSLNTDPTIPFIRDYVL
jgi:hypothetical protein